jgi:hypothetical protein
MSAGDAGSDATDLQRELRSRIEFEHRLSVASAAMMRAGHEQLDGTIVDTLGSIGSLLGVDRAYVFVIDHEAGTQSNSHEWVADGISAEAEYLQNIPLSTFPGCWSSCVPTKRYESTRSHSSRLMRRASVASSSVKASSRS